MTLDDFYIALQTRVNAGTLRFEVNDRREIRACDTLYRASCPINAMGGDWRRSDGGERLGMEFKDVQAVVNAADHPHAVGRARLLDACGLTPVTASATL